MKNINIHKIDKSNENECQLFVNFPLDIYENKKLILYHTQKVKSMIQGKGDFDLFLAETDSHEIVGRMAMGKNNEILDEKNIPYAYIGLFDVVNDYNVFKEMLDFGKKYFSKSNSILFPFFKSTWFPYRFASKGFEHYNYFMEFPDHEYYSEFTTKYGYEESYKYLGSITYDMESIITDNEYSYHKALKNNIRFRNLDKSRPKEDLKFVYDLTVGNYNNKTNRFFTTISFEEFYGFYDGIVSMLDSEFLTFGLNEKDEAISYCFSPPDYTPIILGTSDTVTGFIPKTAATDKNYRKMGVMGGIVYLQGLEAKKRNYKYAIGGYTDERLFTHKVMPDSLKWKEYTLYRLKV
ncbi:hypothetical protein MHK_005779 [Candidatus Magnetomorum sp. HK-1]|nr:hypothetical protein MHK_005779 [Candidatus Magnetomorum sp. HK-1]